MITDPVEQDYNDPAIRERLAKRFAKEQTQIVTVGTLQVLRDITNYKYDVRITLDGHRTSFYLDSIAYKYINQVYGGLEGFYRAKGVMATNIRIKKVVI